MDAGPSRNLPVERSSDHAEPRRPERVRHLLAGLGLILLLIGGTGPNAALVNATPVIVGSSAAGPAGSLVDEQAVEISTTRVVRRRQVARSIRRRLCVTSASLHTLITRLQSSATHRWFPNRQLPPPLWRGPPLFTL